ncbi:hypothetical protein AX14_013803 [Amanita brunnescens Koide BX004]|nr:hypothetical protein AX14_013803 [Amanita brunnescens Koide BX004]
MTAPIMMEIVLAAIQNEMTIEDLDKIMLTTVQVSTTTVQSDEAQHTTSIEASSVPKPSMSTDMPMSTSMRSKQRLVAIIMGGLAAGIAVFGFVSVIAMLWHNTLQRRRGNGRGNGYDVKNHEMDDEDDDNDSDDIEDQHPSSHQLQTTTRTTDSAASVQSLDIPPTYSLAITRSHSLPNYTFHASTTIAPSSTRSSTPAPPAYGPPGYEDAVLAAR